VVEEVEVELGNNFVDVRRGAVLLHGREHNHQEVRLPLELLRPFCDFSVKSAEVGVAQQTARRLVRHALPGNLLGLGILIARPGREILAHVSIHRADKAIDVANEAQNVVEGCEYVLDHRRVLNENTKLITRTSKSQNQTSQVYLVQKKEAG
jgi:hypothetical protein